MAITTVDAFFKGAAKATGVRVNPGKVVPLGTLAVRDVVLFRDPANAGFASAPPELGIVVSIAHDSKAGDKLPKVLTIVPLTPMSKSSFEPNTPRFWVIDRRQDVHDLGLNPSLNYKLGHGLNMSEKTNRDDTIRIIPVVKSLIDPDPTRTDTVLRYGRCPDALWLRLEINLFRKWQADEDVRKQMLHDVKRAHANRDNLEVFSKQETVTPRKPNFTVEYVTLAKPAPDGP